VEAAHVRSANALETFRTPRISNALPLAVPPTTLVRMANP
jgi:hypothetical protein